MGKQKVENKGLFGGGRKGRAKRLQQDFNTPVKVKKPGKKGKATFSFAAVEEELNKALLKEKRASKSKVDVTKQLRACNAAANSDVFKMDPFEATRRCLEAEIQNTKKP
eukprot:GHVO01027217.1.p1 GENE.GHVO01027217.1~~GHVO01027217.1.p1  ORF type:complete len:109 (+),score=20.97 GHVO01027217.1:362-688(+)